MKILRYGGRNGNEWRESVSGGRLIRAFGIVHSTVMANFNISRRMGRRYHYSLPGLDIGFVIGKIT